MNTSTIQIVVSAYRQPPCTLLLEWLQRLPYLCGTWRIGSQEYGIDVARNQDVFRFLHEDVPAGRTHLLMIDYDMVPLGPTKEILTEEGDLLGCGYVGHQGSPGHIAEIGCGFMRVSFELLTCIEKPWFQTRYDENLTRRLECECSEFYRKALAVRDESHDFRQVGVVGHQQGGDTGCILIPDSRQKSGWALAWPADLRKSSPPGKEIENGESS